MKAFIKKLKDRSGASAARYALGLAVFVQASRNQSGASAAEYAMILAIVGSAIALASIFLGGVVAEAINEAGTCIDSNGSTCT